MENSAMKMDLFFANGSKAGIQLERSTIGSGADARIYRIVDYPELAAKVYHDPDKDPSRADKVRAMMDAPPDLPTIQEKGTTYCQIAWPVGRLKSPRQVCGLRHALCRSKAINGPGGGDSHWVLQSSSVGQFSRPPHKSDCPDKMSRQSLIVIPSIFQGSNSARPHRSGQAKPKG